MIESVGGVGMSMPPQRMQQNLSSDQQLLVEETLAKYDLDNLTEDDAKAIVSAFAEAGIEPGKALEAAMEAAGADAKEVGDLAGVKGPPGNRPPPPPKEDDTTDSVELSSIVEYLEEILAEKDLADLSEADREDIYTQLLDRFGLSAGESLINITA